MVLVRSGEGINDFKLLADGSVAPLMFSAANLA